MTVEEVAELVEQYQGVTFEDSHRGTLWDRVINSQEYQTGIYLDFEDEKLVKSEVIWVDGILHASTLPVRHYCQNSGAGDSEKETPPPPP